ncbi:MAG TPA: helix-turn-helix transcriptional regulator [Solirubrobacteraceae bacterium]
MGRTIHEARKAQQLTQVELALAAGISTRALHSIEHGTLSPRLDTLQRILSVLGMTLEIAVRPTRRMSSEQGTCDQSAPGEEHGPGKANR